MIDLSEVSGLPIKFNEETYQISFGPQMRSPLYSTREIDAIRPLLLEPWCRAPEVIYWMYRNTGLMGDEHLLAKHRLRYDISIFVPTMLGPEYLKTSGHYHPPALAGGIAYPEVYEILYGEALYVLQKVDNYEAGPDEVNVQDIITIRGRPGDKVIMPPDYGHVTINTLDVPLVMCNWVCDDFSSYYQSVEDAYGFAYYLVNEDGEDKWIVNHRYVNPVSPLQFAEVQPIPELGLEPGVPMYTACQKSPELFTFLNWPDKFEEVMWKGLKLWTDDNSEHVEVTIELEERYGIFTDRRQE